MKSQFKLFVICTLLLALSGCAYRYYLGLHGPSIKLYPDEHEMEVTADHKCLECHHPDNDPVGPSTSHPNFFGCLKCHNDEVVGWNKNQDYISLNQSASSLRGQEQSK